MSGNIPEQLIEKPPISVAGITFYIKEILEQDYQLQQISVIGEVSSTNLISGSLYFTLSESDNSASIPCAIWRNTLQNIHHQPQKGEQRNAVFGSKARASANEASREQKGFFLNSKAQSYLPRGGEAAGKQWC